MDETLTCVCCGAKVHRDEVYFVGDQPLCRDYADEETFVCDNCGFRHWGSDNQGDDRYDLCPSCRAEYFVACSECGRMIPNSSHDRLHIYKRPHAANKTLLLPSASPHVVMGHVRMTTQVSAQSNYNNHPFPGDLDGHLPGSGPDFALAHNSVLSNDLLLCHQLHLSKTRIETDSYVAAQMLASARTLDLVSLAWIAEQLEGTFTLTILDKQGNLYKIYQKIEEVST